MVRVLVEPLFFDEDFLLDPLFALLTLVLRLWCFGVLDVLFLLFLLVEISSTLSNDGKCSSSAFDVSDLGELVSSGGAGSSTVKGSKPLAIRNSSKTLALRRRRLKHLISQIMGLKLGYSRKSSYLSRA